MGFFSSILGGSKSSSSSGGFNQLPESIQGAYTDYGQQLRDLLSSGNLTRMYRPLAQTAGETRAYDAINRGFAPTQDSINSDIAMQQNPYDQYVIDEINRQSGGDYSLLKQSLNEAGQMGSNRQNLGANDIDLSRLNQIGSFKQDWYKDAMRNALTTLPGARQQDAFNQLGAGSAQRDLYGEDQRAQLTALQEFARALGILPTTEGSSTSTAPSFGGIGGLLQGGAAAYAASDIDLKENIVHEGTENGFNIYSFNYKGDEDRFIGVIAQEVRDVKPDAVIEEDGYLSVNYDAIGVEFRRA